MGQLAERDAEALEPGAPRDEVLLRVDHAAAGRDGARLAGLRRGPADVVDRGLGAEADRPAGLPQPLADVDVLAVEEEALVETVDGCERSAADEHAGARHPVRLARGLVG